MLTTQSLVTLLLIAVCAGTMTARGRWNGIALTAGLAASLGGDLFLSNRAGTEWRFLAGIGMFAIAHGCFLLHARLRWRSWNRPVAAAAGTAYGIYFLCLACCGEMSPAVFVCAALYAALSLTTLAAAAGRRRGFSGGAFLAGIGLLLFSDTVISFREFLGWDGIGFLILPTYLLSQVLLTLALVFEPQL